jgi:hypothetical protein
MIQHARWLVRVEEEKRAEWAAKSRETPPSDDEDPFGK